MQCVQHTCTNIYCGEKSWGPSPGTQSSLCEWKESKTNILWRRTDMQRTVNQIEPETLECKHLMFYLQTILSGDDNDTRLVLISFRSVMGEETAPKWGHHIYSERHMTFSANWCGVLCNVTNSWLSLTRYLWFSLSLPPPPSQSITSFPSLLRSSTCSRTDGGIRHRIAH